MLKDLKPILEIQELDMQMIQLMLLKRRRQKELEGVNASKEAIRALIVEKETSIFEVKRIIKMMEGEHQEVLAKIKKLEAQQSAIKKVDEYNTLTQELSQTDRERINKEQKLSDFYDQQASEEDTLKNLQTELDKLTESSKVIEQEIYDSIKQINEEGQTLKKERDTLVNEANPEVFKVYERLLCNKKDRVVVSLENRCCTGCHIMLTPQHENLVRKGERLIFCEHCSRIHYWQESVNLEDSATTTKTRRRRPTAKS